MAKVHSIHAAKTNLSRLVRRVCAGEDVIIARGKNPVARLVKADGQPVARRFGAMRGRARITRAFFEPLPPEELKSWER